MRALQPALHMRAHQLRGLLRIARRERGQNRAMLGQRARHRVAPHDQRRSPKQVQLADEPAIRVVQLRVARRCDERIVKRDVRPRIRIVIARRECGAHRIDPVAQQRELTRVDARSQHPARRLFEHRAHRVNLVRLRERHRPHEHAAILLGAHEPRLLERAKRLAHRPARHLQPCRPVGFIELVTRRQRAVDDMPLDLVAHQRRQRMAAHDVERIDGIGVHIFSHFDGFCHIDSDADRLWRVCKSRQSPAGQSAQRGQSSRRRGARAAISSSATSETSSRISDSAEAGR